MTETKYDSLVMAMRKIHLGIIFKLFSLLIIGSIDFLASVAIKALLLYIRTCSQVSILCIVAIGRQCRNTLILIASTTVIYVIVAVLWIVAFTNTKG